MEPKAGGGCWACDWAVLEKLKEGALDGALNWKAPVVGLLAGFGAAALDPKVKEAVASFLGAPKVITPAVVLLGAAVVVGTLGAANPPLATLELSWPKVKVDEADGVADVFWPN